MSTTKNLNASLLRLRKRVRLLMAEKYGLWGLATGCVTSMVSVLLSPIVPVLLDYRLWAAVPILAAAAGIVWGLLKRLNDFAVVLETDRRTGLKERISTAYIVREKAGEIESAIVSDAENYAAVLAPADVFPHKLGLQHKVACAAAVLLLAAILIPESGVFQSKAKRQETVVMKREGASMLKVAKEIAKRVPNNEREMRRLAIRMNALGRKMQTGRLAKKTAMLQSRKLAEESRKLEERLARATSLKSLEQAKADMGKFASDAAKRMAQQIAKDQNIPLPEAIKRVPSDSRMTELARKSGNLTDAERTELEKLVKKYSDPSNAVSAPPELAEAMLKLAQNGDYQKAMETMRDLAKKLDLKSLSPSDKIELQKQLQELAKALKNTDLNELAKQMRENAEKLAKMSDAELKQLAEKLKQMQAMAHLMKKAGGT